MILYSEKKEAGYICGVLSLEKEILMEFHKIMQP